MGKTDVSKDVSRRNPNKGTSARTRAFSFEEIMSRRKKKQNSNANETDIKIHESFENANDTRDHSSHDVHLQIRSPSKDVMKVRSKKKESTSKRERDAIERKHTSSRDLETDAKVKSIHGKISRNQESTEEKYSRHSSKNAKLLATESEKASRKKRVKDFDENDKYDEHYRISKRDRKGDYHYDDKGRSKNDSKKYKKHESIKLQDLKYSEWKGHKKYHLEHSYEDPRLKRRRSRSLEYYREERRSGSMSPLSQKHSYDGKDHGESHKDNSKKKHSDGDRYKTSGNGGYSSGHHRKHRSGLGGYSPRKRKTEAAVKTPSPTIRSPERKIATWDQLPSGTSITNSGSIFASFPLVATKVVEAVSSIAVTPATTKTHPATSIDSGSMVINSSIESVQLTQATRPLRRLYIENLPSLASEKSVIDCLNEYLVSSGANHIRTTRPCISCIINKDKAQALVEFLTPEDATAALSFDGNSFAGSVLKMRRPKDFVEAASGVPEKTTDVVRAVSDVVIDSPYKIFVGGISDILSSKMLMEIANAFGPLKAYRFDFNKELNGPCAFLEYEDNSITSKACAGLNGLTLGGFILTAVRAFPDINVKEDNARPPSYAVPPHVKPLLANVTQVLGLHNVINQEDFHTLSEKELEETLEDVRLECARFGTVKAVHLVRHSSSSNEPKSVASELSDSVNASAVLESNVSFHIGSKEKADEMHLVKIAEASTPIYVEEPENVKDEDRLIKEDEMKESAGPSEDLQDIDEGTNIQIEEGCIEENDLISKFPAPKEMPDAKLAEETKLDPIAADKEEDKGNDERKFVEERDLESSQQQANLSEAFEPGFILVEFQRKEAACNAAHCLHGRSYGERTVAIEYIPHDVYFNRFPK
ncbi:hypothetical protein M5K25_016221 [Dendrobium thyrsiflorum]|uniref:RRM domain-containing protein n=1 Tax=Dendrobium thyrsiflorum TaxID=117978 RepID=A0ABD0UJ82_DENTH